MRQPQLIVVGDKSVFPATASDPGEFMSQPADTRFSRDSRLTNAHQYTRVFAKNSRSADKYFTILSRGNLDSGPDSGPVHGSGSDLDPGTEGKRKGFSKSQTPAARLGMAVAKKCAKRAVDRNRLKRLARESFRQHKHSLAGFDIVLLARHASVTASNQDLLKSLENHWSRVSKNA